MTNIFESVLDSAKPFVVAFNVLLLDHELVNVLGLDHVRAELGKEVVIKQGLIPQRAVIFVVELFDGADGRPEPVVLVHVRCNSNN